MIVGLKICSHNESHNWLHQARWAGNHSTPESGHYESQHEEQYAHFRVSCWTFKSFSLCF